MLAFINLLLLITFLLFINHVHHLTLAAARRHVFIYSACSSEKYEPNTPYEANLNSLLSSIVASSSQSLYNPFAVGNDSTSTPSSAAAYGLYQCRGDLNPRDCSTCVAGLISEVALLCPYTRGASVQLEGCFVRYEGADFLGRLDDGLRYKSCGGGGSGLVRRRDDVLAELSGEGAATEGFRVRAMGAVEGYAQCLGDLTAADCGECLREAAAEVRRLCGETAAAGEVFLGQCYVRYWESGYYDSSSDSSNQDDVGRTVAIIVGAVAGVAVLIVLLSFCRKTLSK